MASAKSKDLKPVVLVWGEDEFAVKQRARAIFQEWAAGAGGFDQEIIDGDVSNSGDALAVLGKLRESLQTLPFFGGTKIVWFRNCTFLGDERAASTKAVTESLAELAQEFKEFKWDGVKLLISAGKVDKRKTFYKTLEKIGSVEGFTGWSAEDREWPVAAEQVAEGQLQSLEKTISAEALAQLIANVGPNSRQLHREVEKLALFVGDRAKITARDVETIVTRNKQSRAFAVGDALGARDLPGLLKALDEEFWEMRTDSQKSEIGILYGLISKVRSMIFLKEMQRAGWIKADADYSRFKMQLERVPAEALPTDRRFNPLASNPYVLFKAMAHARKYTVEELVRAMELLLECNQKLIFSSLDETLVLQQTLVSIVNGTGGNQIT